MRFLVLAIILAVEHFMPSQKWRRAFNVMSVYFSQMEKTLGEDRLANPVVALCFLVLPPAIITLLIVIAIGPMLGGLLLMLFNAFVLLYSLQGCHFRAENTLETQSEKLLKLFTLLFWFVIFGAFGVVVSRLLQALSESDKPYAQTSKIAYDYAAWIPSRLLAASFALVGNFTDVMNRWMLLWKSARPEGMVSDSAMLSLREEYSPEKMITLAHRALLICLAIYALIVLV